MESKSVFGSPPEVTAAFELSGSLRTTGFVLCLTVVFAAIVLFVYRPAVSDDDLFTKTFTPSIAVRLVRSDGAHIAAMFSSHVDVFDSPYDAMARAYIAAKDETEQTNVLLKFLNAKSESQRQYLLLLTEIDGVKHSLNEYLEDTKARWQTFSLPVLGIQISRNQGAIYLCVGFAALHLYYTVKHRYLLAIRRNMSTVELLPDPSILSATPHDLQMLAKPLRCLVYFGQESLLVLVPIGMCVLVGYFFFKTVAADFNDYKGTFIGFLFLCAEALIAVAIQVSDWKRKRHDWNQLLWPLPR